MIRRIDCPRELLQEFRGVAKRGYPNERFAYFFGRVLQTRVNIDMIYVPDEDGQKEYSGPEFVSPPMNVHAVANALARENNLDVVGTIHSHPDPHCIMDHCQSERDVDFDVDLGPVSGICRVRPTKQGLRSTIRLWLNVPQPEVTT